MAIQFLQVDAFTDRVFSGNPAAVCFLAEARDDIWMQSVAAEMNLSETAFLLPREECYSLRWFTPITEVDLCGHATLASAHVLWETGRLAPDETAHFETRSGALEAERKSDGIEMCFPLFSFESISTPAGLCEALGLESAEIFLSGDKHIVFATSERTVRELTPDFAALAAFPGRGVMVTSAA